MEYQEIIQRRTARELRPHTLVNLGIGLPTGVAHYVKHEDGVLFQSENGIIGMGGRPPAGAENPYLTDAGGNCVTAVPGAMSLDSALSFGLIRRHVDTCVLGGLEVDETGRLANWMVPGKIVPGMGGAMDLVANAKRIIVAMQHIAKGQPKIVPKCTLPLTADRRIDLIVTDLAVIEPTEEGLVLREYAPGVSVEDIIDKTSARLIIPDVVTEMPIAAK